MLIYKCMNIFANTPFQVSENAIIDYSSIKKLKVKESLKIDR